MVLADGVDEEGEYLLVCGGLPVPELLLCFSQAPSVRTEVGPVGVETVSCGSEAGQCSVLAMLCHHANSVLTHHS